MIAEDEPALLESYCELVTGLGHECIAARDGREALALARSTRPDLIVTDLMMPNSSGLELIRELKRDPALSKIPVLLLSAGRPAQADRDAAWRFLAKPVNLARFEQAVFEGLQAAASAIVTNVASARAEAVSADTLLREAMLSWVAHEIKSPLSAALAASQLAVRGLDSAEDAGVVEEAIGDGSAPTATPWMRWSVRSWTRRSCRTASSTCSSISSSSRSSSRASQKSGRRRTRATSFR